MVSAFVSRSSGPGSTPGRGHCFVFLGKTLNSHSASLHPGREKHWAAFNGRDIMIFSVYLCLLHCFPAVSSSTVIYLATEPRHPLVKRHRVLPRFNTYYYSNFIHCTNSDFLIG